MIVYILFNTIQFNISNQYGLLCPRPPLPSASPFPSSMPTLAGSDVFFPGSIVVVVVVVAIFASPVRHRLVSDGPGAVLDG